MIACIDSSSISAVVASPGTLTDLLGHLGGGLDGDLGAALLGHLLTVLLGHLRTFWGTWGSITSTRASI